MKKLFNIPVLISTVLISAVGCAQQPVFNPAMADPDAPINIVDYGVLPPNRVGGVDFSIQFNSASTKTIKYIDFSSEAYNRVGDKVTDDITGQSLQIGRFVGPLASGGHPRSSNRYLLWYNPSIYCARIVGVRIEFMDGEVREFQGSKIDKLLQQSGCRKRY